MDPQPRRTRDRRHLAASATRAFNRRRRHRAGVVRLAFGGDTMLGSTTMPEGIPDDAGRAAIAAYRPWLRDADLAFVNYEGVFADAGTSTKGVGDGTDGLWAFRSPTPFAATLAWAGIDAVSVANNHANDFGGRGRADTTAALAAVGVAHTGPLGHRCVLERRGRRIAIVGFASSPLGNDLRDLDTTHVLIAEAAATNDLVVVSFHGGAEGAEAEHTPHGTETYYGASRGDVRAFAQVAVEAGAHVVVGHGPHVVRGMEWLHGRLVAYSLGNFVTYGGFSFEGPTANSALLTLDLDATGAVVSGRVVSGVQALPGGARLDPRHGAARRIGELSRDDFGADGVRLGPSGSLELRSS